MLTQHNELEYKNFFNVAWGAKLGCQFLLLGKASFSGAGYA
ncbi:hypothetical protein EC2726950_0403 [Escherichia coli 2726950]|nr:hypothetical protein EC2726950_0403 [Escherichia coli 2726950]ENH01322.1 hypothetical protein ECP03018677_5363 [Escherichia coli P0301867.7]